MTTPMIPILKKNHFFDAMLFEHYYSSDKGDEHHVPTQNTPILAIQAIATDLGTKAASQSVTVMATRYVHRKNHFQNECQ